MKNKIISLFILSIYAVSLNANNDRFNECVFKFNQIKNDNYIKKLTHKRDLNINQRDARDLVRKYQELSLSRR